MASVGDRKYVRVYYSIIDDPRFVEIYPSDSALALWIRLLLTADALYPAPAPLPLTAKLSAVRALVDAGVVELLPGKHYRIHGLHAEREARSESARIANTARWGVRSESVRSPNGRNPESERRPSRDEHKTSRDEQNARASDDDPEGPILTWLAKAGAYIPPTGNGLHRMLVEMVGKRGEAATIAALEEARSMGNDDARGLVFVAKDILFPLHRATNGKDSDGENGGFDRRVVATKRQLHRNGGHSAETDPECPLCAVGIGAEP